MGCITADTTGVVIRGAGVWAVTVVAATAGSTGVTTFVATTAGATARVAEVGLTAGAALKDTAAAHASFQQTVLILTSSILLSFGNVLSLQEFVLLLLMFHNSTCISQ